MKVLIVDDQYINRYLLEVLLTGYGFEVVSAEDGMKALELIRENGIDLIISDILLPKMDGFQFCREIKSNPEYQHIPFVFYTAAYTEKKDQEFAESLGADRFILKPTDPAEFIAIIRNLMAEYPNLAEITPKPMVLKEDEYLSEHNRRLFHQLEKKLVELEGLNRALQRSEERYKNLFENANDAIILYDDSPSGEPGRIREVNRVACRRLGYSREELLGMKISDIRTPKSQQKYEEIFPHLSTSGDITFEGEHQSRSGQIIPVEISAHFYHENGYSLCLSICRDVTARKRAMEELSQAIVQIDNNIHQMATIGDEIRNPLAIILSSCQECNERNCQKVISAVQKIDAFISRLDQGWVESDKVRAFLMKYYTITSDETANN